MRALVVSEHEPERDWVHTALGADWDFTDAANGREALEHARAGRFDLVIADETTEPYGAFGLARELKILEEPPAVVVLLERPQDAWLSRWSGADRWFVRPVDPFALAAAARDLVAPAVAPAAPTEADAPAG